MPERAGSFKRARFWKRCCRRFGLLSCLSWRGIFHESWKNKIEIRMGGLRETGASLLFSLRRAHLLTTASAQTPYPSPRRKRQVSSIPLCLLFPQSQRLCGSPFAAVVFPAENVRSARRMRLLRQPPDNATAPAGAAVIVCAGRSCFRFGNSLLPARANLPPAALLAAMPRSLTPGHFLFCERETEKERTR